MAKQGKIGKISKTILALATAGALTLSGFLVHNERQKQVVKKTPNVSAPRGFDLEDVTSDANRKLIEFPNEIPGAKSVEKYVVPEAKYTLVHVRQAHLVSEEHKEIVGENKDKIEAVQEDIYKILLHLADNHGLKQVYEEAVSKETAPVENVMANLDKTISKIDINSEKLEREEKKLQLKYKKHQLKNDIGLAFEAEEKYPNNPKEFNEYIQRRKEEIKEEITQLESEILKPLDQRDVSQRIREKNKYSATFRLSAEGKIEIVAAEDAMTNILASKLLDEHLKKKTKLISELILDDREDILLEIISKQDSSLAVSVYGGAHAWGGYESCGEDYHMRGRRSYKDNITEWNKKNPDKKFSLIEVVPESYE